MSIAHTVLMLAVIGSPAGAAMVKCQGSGTSGSVTYQDVPCAAGKELRNFDTDPANVSVVPGIVPPPPAKNVPHDTRPYRATRLPVRAERRSASKRPPGGDAAERKHISSGMAQGEVLARIGKPNVVSGGRKEKHWVYLPAPGDESTMTTLSMSEGRVARVERKVMR